MVRIAGGFRNRWMRRSNPRLTAEFDAAGIPAQKAAKLALKAAELAAGQATGKNGLE